ncbi:hypothetical protein [Granulosicoccus antarcticus]|uniref:Uncharacterized protein n=1 Tax=Granulosicoccus antarcticus IMCC3135 TaxID=1192854 RepID=A0A2Z2NYI0_9GAMM|nr:hypothetical protein [Granulosicoccus antarcticus]ASJ73910.1 hypothetical protein IMCC3135_19155 [Granulosicoccus antarcticus IMCC3135]
MNSLKIALLSSALAATNLFAETIDERIVQADKVVDGQTVDEYVNTWWQWTYTMPSELNPVRDYTGKHCHVGQQGDVWFLAGGYGSSTINRQCEIPAGKYIFFPVINMVYFPRYPNSYTCDMAKTSAALNNDKLLDIYIELDGITSWNPASTRMASPDCFDLLGMVPKEYEPPKVYPAATDGYWVMLKPLSKGKHTLKFQAVYDRQGGAYGRMAQDIEYELNIR